MLLLLAPLLAAVAVSATTHIPTITATPLVVPRSGDNVTFSISFSDGYSPNAKDWVGLWYGAPAYNGSYVMYAYVGDLGGLSMTVSLYNLRLGAAFLCYYPSTSSSHLAPFWGCSSAASSPRFALGTAEPQLPQLSLGGEDGSVVLTFFSGRNATGVVWYGEESGVLDKEAKELGAPDSYSETDMCEPPAADYTWIAPGFIHHILLSNLTASKPYFYKFGFNTSLQSQEHTLIAPLPSPSTAPTTFLFFADMGTRKGFCDACTLHRVQQHGPGALPMVQQMVASKDVDDAAFLLLVGDLSYARSTSIVWDIFSHTITPIASKRPLQVELDHESDTLSGGEKSPLFAAWDGDSGGYHPSWGDFGDDSGGECAVPTFHRFSAPSSAGSNGIAWYTFASGLVRVVVVTAEASLQPGSLQYKWLQQTLASADRSVTPWLFVAVHRPAYNSEEDRPDYLVSLHLRTAIEPLLQKYSVDFLLAGHYHSYQRTAPVFQNQTAGAENDPQGTVHITAGTAGIGFDTPNWYQRAWDRKHYATVFAYTRFDALNATHLAFKLISSTNGSTLDQVLYQSNHNFPQHNLRH